MRRPSGLHAGIASRENDLMIKRSWTGYLGQAGVSLGIANLIAKAYPSIGAGFYTVVIAAIALNQIVGPVLLKFLLGAAGETAERRFEESVSHV